MTCPKCKTEMDGSTQCPNCGMKTKAVPAVYKGVGLVNGIVLLVLFALYIVFLTKPIFYFTQSYCGGVFNEKEVMEVCIAECRDLERYEKTNGEFQIIVGGACFFLFIALLNAVSCALRLFENCPKSPVNKAVGSFFFTLSVTGLYGTLKIAMNYAVQIAAEHESVFTAKELDMFNVCDAVFWLGIVATLISLINIITSVNAKKEGTNIS